MSDITQPQEPADVVVGADPPQKVTHGEASAARGPGRELRAPTLGEIGYVPVVRDLGAGPTWTVAQHLAAEVGGLGTLATLDFVNAAQIAGGAVRSAHVAGGAITQGHLANLSVGTAQLLTDAVTMPKIMDGVVTSAKLAENAAWQNLGFFPLNPVNNLSELTQTVGMARANLGLGTAAIANIGASGNTVPLLSGINTWSASQSFSGGIVSLTNVTSNWIDFGTTGVAVPSVTTRSPGTKVVLYSSLSPIQVDFADGVEAGARWSSVPSTATSFKWYAGVSNIMTLTGAGGFSLVGTAAFGNSAPSAGVNALTLRNTGGGVNASVTLDFDATGAGLGVRSSQIVCMADPAGNGSSLLLRTNPAGAVPANAVSISSAQAIRLFGAAYATPGLLANDASGNITSLAYATGSWTPAVTFANPGDFAAAYSEQFGEYTRIGNRVFFNLSLHIASMTWTTASGSFLILGPPDLPPSTSRVIAQVIVEGSLSTHTGILVMTPATGDSWGITKVNPGTAWVGVMDTNIASGQSVNILATGQYPCA
jgi:hypothetical protein